jgi:hypothetical protein
MVLLFAAATQSVQARERAAGPVADLRDTGPRAWPAFFGELRRLGDVESHNLTVERYSGEGRPDRHGDVARTLSGRDRCPLQPSRAGRPLYRFSADAEAITMANKAPTLPFPPAGKG